jgi:hypothetical protein
MYIVGFNPYSVGYWFLSFLLNLSAHANIWFQSLFSWILVFKKQALGVAD